MQLLCVEDGQFRVCRIMSRVWFLVETDSGCTWGPCLIALLVAVLSPEQCVTLTR